MKMKQRDWNMAEGEWVNLVSPTGSKSAVCETIGMMVYKLNGVRRQDKQHVICKLCDTVLSQAKQQTD